MDFREALQAGKIGIGGASDHWTRLFGQKVLGGYAQGYAEGAIASFNDGAKDAPVDKLLVEINPVQTGTGDPSPENIRPISGWTGAQVQRTGKNLFDINAISEISVGTINRYGVWFNKPGNYAVSAQNSGGYLYARIFNADGSIKNTYFVVSTVTITNATFTIADGESFAVFDAVNSGEAIAKQRFNSWKCQVETGSLFTTYTPYTGTTYPITWQNEAGTVYGGELDVTSGVLRVTYANIASYAGETINEPWISSMDKYVAGATPTTGAQVVYPLATPLTYQLTPTEVTTLLGVNNVWADTGDVKVWYKKKK